MSKKKAPEPAPTPAKVSTVIRLFAYAGARTGSKGKPYHAHVPVTENWFKEPPPSLDAALLFEAALDRRLRPGIVFSIESPADTPTSVLPSTVKIVGPYRDRDVAVWDAEHRATLDAAAIAKEIEKDKKRRISLEPLEPLQKAYHRLRTSQERAVLLARVAQFITTYKPDDR